MIARTTLRSLCLSALVGAAAMPVVAQEGGPNERRVAEIMLYVEARAADETDVWFNDEGDYPRAIQNLRFRSRLRPWDEEIGTSLIWMLGNVRYIGEMLAVAIRFRKENPDNPDRGLPEAQVYFARGLYFKIPPILEEDILRDPPPHGNTFSMIGNAYARLGFHEDALRVWNQYLKHDPDDPRFKMLRDRAIRKLGGEPTPPGVD